MAQEGVPRGRHRQLGSVFLALGVALLMTQPNPSATGQPAPDQKAPVAKPKTPASQPKAAGESAVQPPSAPQVAAPDADRIVLLIRVAMLTLNDALQTGNFTVLRDVGSPAFRDAHTTARLSQVFSGLMAQRVDLSAVAVMAPQLSEVPTIDQRNMLRLKGHFPGQPMQINFEVVYEVVAGRWRLFGIAVAAVPPQTAAIRPGGQIEPAKQKSDAAKK